MRSRGLRTTESRPQVLTPSLSERPEAGVAGPGRPSGPRPRRVGRREGGGHRAGRRGARSAPLPHPAPEPLRVPRQPLGRHSRHSPRAPAQPPEVARPPLPVRSNGRAAEPAASTAVTAEAGAAVRGLRPASRRRFRGPGRWGVVLEWEPPGSAPFPFLFSFLLFCQRAEARAAGGEPFGLGPAARTVKPLAPGGAARWRPRSSGRARAVCARRRGAPGAPAAALSGGGPGSARVGLAAAPAHLSPQPHGAREGEDWAAAQEGQEEEAGPQQAGRGGRSHESRMGI